MHTFTVHLVKMVNDQPTDEQVVPCTDMLDQGKKFTLTIRQLQRKKYSLVETEGARSHYHVYHPSGKLAYLLFTNN
jgi:hypothetical protein